MSRSHDARRVSCATRWGSRCSGRHGRVPSACSRRPCSCAWPTAGCTPVRPRRGTTSRRWSTHSVAISPKLPAEAVDAEAGAWRLPAVAVRAAPAAAPRVPWPDVARAARRCAGRRARRRRGRRRSPGSRSRRSARHVVRVTHPRRPDPFPLRDDAPARSGGGATRPRRRCAPRPVRAAARRRAAPGRRHHAARARERRACRSTGRRSYGSLRSRTTTVRATASRRSAVAVGRRGTTLRGSDVRRSPIRSPDCSPRWSRPTCSRPVVIAPVQRVSLEGAVGHLFTVEARRG